MSRSRTVLVVGPFPPTTGGVTTFMRNLMQSALTERWTFVAHTTSRPSKEGKGTGDASYVGFFQGGFRRGIKSLLVTAGHLVGFPVAVLRTRCDVVQIQSSDFWSFWEAALYTAMARLLGRPACVRFGGIFDEFYEAQSPPVRWVIRRVFDSASAIVVLSEGWRDTFARWADREKIHVIPNGVHVRGPARERGEPVRPVPALFICNTEPLRKGVEELLAAAPRLRGEVVVRCVATTAGVRARIEELGLGDVVVPLGTLDRERLAEEYDAAELFLIPSRGEGLPNSLLEAMAAGLPVVATPVGAMGEILRDGEHGRVIPVEDSEAFGAAVLELANAPGMRREMGARNAALARERYDADVLFRRYGEVWSRLLEGRP